MRRRVVFWGGVAKTSACPAHTLKERKPVVPGPDSARVPPAVLSRNVTLQAGGQEVGCMHEASVQPAKPPSMAPTSASLPAHQLALPADRQ